jgi:hypothetical protein
METLMKILSNHGPWGLVLLVLIYILLKGQLTFRYPRSNDK